MRHSDFVPLHLHTEYSLLDGAIRIKELMEAASEYRMPAVAMTDHGTMFGAVDFYFSAVKAGIKPIIGCEVYVAPDDHKKKGEQKPYHLILLARDNDGYRNLITLVSISFLEGFYKKPRIDKALLEQYSGGLIGLSACLQGEIPRRILEGNMDAAREAALEYRRILGAENFYLEVQDNGIEDQATANEGLVQLASELHMGLVATNDCHYLRESDVKAHEVLLCIQTGKTMADPKRFRFRGSGYYFRSPEEMKESFAHIPEAISNTVAIAERCNVEFSEGKSLLPKIETKDGSRPSEMLEKLAHEGMKKRFGEEPSPEYLDRLQMELGVIKKMGYSSYFLIVGDFIHYAKKNGIPVGPGRGSAAGSLVAYLLEITELDPIKYGLLFERFLNPERVSMPDVDVDFCKERRGDVIKYVQEKYGSDHVAQIITFGTMAARAAIRDVARAMDFPYAEADKLAKLVPETLKITIKEAIKQEPELKKAYDKDEGVRELLDIAMRLEGLSRHASTHAAGVVISPEPLTNYAPLYKSASDEEEVATTQFDMNSVERIGLIKFDFLGLKTLTVIQKCVNLLHSSGIDFSMDDITLDDEETYRFLGTGKTTGVFQLESDGMKDILIKMQPNRFEDIIALVALYRPGPIKSGMIDTFINRKKGNEEIKYELKELKDILDETYGVILYQEQVMSIANRLANFSLGQADVLRKAMGKKKADVMAEQKVRFIEGAVKNNVPEKKAARIFELMEHFAEYGFNKSHSAAYALISYQTAYLKAHYPVHFMAATMTLDIDNSDKIVKSIKECANLGIRVLPPEVNLCGKDFSVDGESIRFGLAAVKGVGHGAVDAIIELRRTGGPFTSVEDYLSRVGGKGVNKKVNESLLKSGAFDTLLEHDGTLASIAVARCKALETVSGGPANPTLSLFGGMDEDLSSEENTLWDETEMLKNEKSALGFYITGSPLRRYSGILEAMSMRTVSELASSEDGSEVSAAGIVMSIRKVRTRKGDLMAALGMEDEEGFLELVLFPDTYREKAGIIEKDMPLYFTGTLEKSDKGLKVVATDVKRLDDALSEVGNRRAVVSINPDEGGLQSLKSLVEKHGGLVPLYLSIRAAGAETLIETSTGVMPDAGFIEGIESAYGKGSIKVV